MLLCVCVCATQQSQEKQQQQEADASARLNGAADGLPASASIRQHPSASVSTRPHTSASDASARLNGDENRRVVLSPVVSGNAGRTPAPATATAATVTAATTTATALRAGAHVPRELVEREGREGRVPEAPTSTDNQKRRVELEPRMFTAEWAGTAYYLFKSMSSYVLKKAHE